MSALSQAAEDYLTVHRTLGHKLKEHGRLLPDFVAYLEARGASRVTTELAVAWATQPATSTPVWWAQRLTVVRGLARHLQAIDPDTEVPPSWLLPYRCRRIAPYLYSDADIVGLMTAARSLRSPQRAATYETLVGLLGVTGMRASEAIRLDNDDVDWEEGILTVWTSKFQKSRAIPLHPTTLGGLARYVRLRDELCPHPKVPSFFLSTTGTRIHISVLDRAFHDLVQRAGLEQQGERQARPHDLRHRFAVRTLLDWYRAGVDVDAHMPLLSTFLGHSHPRDTYWYVSAVPELLFLAAERLERAEQEQS
jgi:integrase